MVSQMEVECDFKFKVIPELKKVYGDNEAAFKIEWESYLKERISEKDIPSSAIEWKYPN